MKEKKDEQKKKEKGGGQFNFRILKRATAPTGLHWGTKDRESERNIKCYIILIEAKMKERRKGGEKWDHKGRAPNIRLD